jgi:tRNA dimethylallyltransferase
MGIGAILIAGPTASGKSALAIRLAERLCGTVINADSMQVYRDLRVITARPTPDEEAAAPHRLFGHVDAAVNYSVARWQADMADTLASVKAEGCLPIVTGGTGLYFKALTQGLSDIPPVHEDVRAAVRADAEGRAPEELHRMLAAVDPVTADRLRPSDPQRIIRALEVFRATGQPLAHFQAKREGALLNGPFVAFFLEPDRDALRARIDARFDRMVQSGAVDEVELLIQRGLDPALPAMRAHGVPWIIRALRGEIAMAEAAEGGKADTRRYAKRQHTWFRHQAPEFQWVSPEAADERILAAFNAAI